MNPVMALVVCLALLAVTTTAWYITMPLGSMVLDVSGDIINGTTNLTDGQKARVSSTWTLERFLLVLWGPLLDVVYVVWFVIFGTRVDTESERRFY